MLVRKNGRFRPLGTIKGDNTMAELRENASSGMRDGRRDISTRLIPGPVWSLL